MPQRRRPSTERSDARGPAPRRGGGGGGAGIVLGLIVLSVVGIGAAGYLHGLEETTAQEAAPQAAPSTPGLDPFAGIGEEAPPSGGATRARLVDRAPEGLFANPVWVAAREVAERGHALAAEARAAKAQDAHQLFQTQGKAAKEAFDEAFTMTVELEQEWIELYGENDGQVRRMIRERNEWQDQMRVFHKTTGR